jgi:hypothetical protein
MQKNATQNWMIVILYLKKQNHVQYTWENQKCEIKLIILKAWRTVYIS